MKEHALSQETVIFQPPETAPRGDDSIRHLIIHQLDIVPADQRVAWIRNDQRERWRKGFHIPIEAYLELPPLADATQDLMLDLIYSEYLLRQELGQTSSADEFAARFPAFGDRLRRLISVDNALFQAETPPGPRCDADLAIPAPMMIGKYPILSVLAEGGQGIVYRGMHPTLGKEVVIKRGKEHVDAGERDRLIAEGQLLARIEHPNLVRVFDLDFHQGQPFLVMEFVDAMNLEQFRDRTPPDPRKAAELVARIARALDAVHQKGITHRDIKPKNILVDDKNEPKLIDFGLAHWRHRYSEAETGSGSVSGTLAYIAPEQARGDEAAIGPRSDLFGLGGVLFFLLTGGAPIANRIFVIFWMPPVRETGTVRHCRSPAFRSGWPASAPGPCRPIRRIATPAASLSRATSKRSCTGPA